MKKLLLIGFKDLRLMFRDRAALTFMLLAPFLLTIGMGFVTGRFGGSSNGLSDIPVVIVNLDRQDLGNALEEMFSLDELADLIELRTLSDPEGARESINEDQAAAAIIIPEGFTESIIPLESSSLEPEAVQIEVYTNPSSPTRAGIVKAIVDEFISQVEEERTSRRTAILQLLNSGLVSPENMGAEVDGLRQKDASLETTAIRLRTQKEGPDAVAFDLLAYFAPGMALMFLMYTVTYGGRLILAERSQGSLPRLMVSPTYSIQILGGKVLGILFMGAAQLGILILASAVFFQVKWGDTLGIIALVLAAVFGATGWGMLITAFARTPAQVGSIGSALMLIFGILGGSFINLEQMPPFLRTISKITPNAWGLDGFTTLALGGGLSQLMEPILALLGMGFVLLGISAIAFNRKGLMQS